jgi:hypothetical protein
MLYNHSTQLLGPFGKIPIGLNQSVSLFPLGLAIGFLICASSVWKTGSRDIRDVLKIAKLCNPVDTEEDITRVIAIHQKYRKTGREYN